MKISGLKELEVALQELAQGQSVEVEVGFQTDYAVYVHEDLEAKHGAAYNAAYINQESVKTKRGKNKGETKIKLSWTPEARRKGYHINAFRKPKKAVLKGQNQQAKYLEKPARELQPTIIQLVKVGLRQGRTMASLLKQGGLLIQREAQLIVPVETGFLKRSAFTQAVEGNN